MIIYLYGPDAYQRQEKLNWYLDKFKEKHSALTVESFDLEDEKELIKLKEFATAQSLFENSKFGILNNLSEAEPKELDGVFKISIDSKILTLAISSEKDLSKDFKILKNKEGVMVEEFKIPTGAALTNFIKKAAMERKIKLSPEHSLILAKNYQSDTWGLITELDKLAMGGSPEAAIEGQDFFGLISQMQRSGSAKYQLPILERLLQNNDAAMVFNFLASRASGNAKIKMADYDVAIKSGKLEYEEALLDAILA